MYSKIILISRYSLNVMNLNLSKYPFSTWTCDQCSSRCVQCHQHQQVAMPCYKTLTLPNLYNIIMRLPTIGHTGTPYFLRSRSKAICYRTFFLHKRTMLIKWESFYLELQSSNFICMLPMTSSARPIHILKSMSQRPRSAGSQL